LKKVLIYTDGSCKGNPGPGGWAAILEYGNHTKEIFGSERQTTNNRMELTAAVEALNALKERCEVDIVTDSEYVRNGIMSWLAGWKRNGWLTKTRKPVLNQELWVALDEAASRHKVHWRWTRGHARDKRNIRCDELAQQAAARQIHSSQ